MDAQIRPTTTETRNEFSAILREATAWQKARGLEAWSHAFDDSWMLPRIERGELFLGFLEHEPVCTIQILWEDRPFWGEREVGDSIYLHAFSVRPSRAGLGLGKEVIEKVTSMGREHGRTKARLDCFLSSANLIAYYERTGFVSVATTSIKGKMINLMEREIGGRNLLPP